MALLYGRKQRTYGLCRYSGHAGTADFIKNLSGVIEVPKTDEMNVNIAERKV